RGPQPVHSLAARPLGRNPSARALLVVVLPRGQEIDHRDQLVLAAGLADIGAELASHGDEGYALHFVVLRDLFRLLHLGADIEGVISLLERVSVETVLHSPGLLL